MTEQGENLLEKFREITNATEDEANHWLMEGNFDVEQAVSLFCEAKSAMEQPSLASTVAAASIGAVPEGGIPSSANTASYLDYHHHRKFDEYDEEGIRRPDSVKKQRLMDDGAESLRYPLGGKSRVPLVSAFASGVGSSSSSSSSSSNTNAKTLANLYKTPTDLMTTGDLWSVREQCKTEEKWLLVNIQSEKEFKCHELTRDVWNDPDMQDIVRSSFVFWQQLEVSQEGALFCQRYRVTEFPHIAILDPRTGAVEWIYEHGTTKTIHLREKFVERLLDWLGGHPYPQQGQGQLLRSTSSSSSSSSNGSGNPMMDLSTSVSREEEEGKGSSSSSSSSSGKKEEEKEEEIVVPNGFDPATLPSLTSNGNTSTAAATLEIKLKLPPLDPSSSSLRIIKGQSSIRLSTTTPVVVLAAHAAAALAEVPGWQGRCFELYLTFPRTALSVAVREMVTNHSRSSTSTSSSSSSSNSGIGEGEEVTLADLGIKSDTAVTVQLMS